MNSIGSAGLAVRVDGVTQKFSLHHEKTLRGLVVNAVRRSHPSRESFLALRDVSLEVPVGATMGLIGHNGSGKSTLLKIIGGVLTPTTGQVTRRGTLAALLELGAGFQRDLSGRENVFMNAELLGLSKKQTEDRFDQIVEFSGVGQFIDTPMKFYSSGMFVRLGFSVAIHTDPDVLLVDEVLAVGDEEFRAKCLDVVRSMQNEGRTIILVTHNMDQVVQFCDEAVLLHHGQVRAQGVPDEVIARFRELTSKDAARRQAAGPTGDRPRGPSAGAAGHRRPSAPGPSAPQPGARVVRADVRALSGHPLSQFRPPDGLVVDAVLSVPGPATGPGVVARVEIFSGGHLLYGTSTDRLGLAAFVRPSEVGLRFTFADLPLAGGHYRVAVSVAPDGRAPALHTIASAGEIQVATDGRSLGPLGVLPSVERLG